MKKDEFVFRSDAVDFSRRMPSERGNPAPFSGAGRLSCLSAVRQKRTARVLQAPSERGPSALKNRPRSERNKFILLLIMGGLWSGISFADDNPNAWQQMKGQDFTIYYRQDVPDDFVQTTMDTAEDELKRVTDNMGITNSPEWSWDKQIKIYIYSDHDDFVKNGNQAVWAHGVAFAKTRTIKTYPEVDGFFDTILPHELGHIVFRDYIGFTANVPLWFEEGVAIYQEKAKRLGSNQLVQKAIENGQFIPLSRLTGMRLYKDSANQVVDVFYTESASVVYYMITELGDQEFYLLLGELKNGTPFEEALHKVYLRFKTIDDLNEAWVDYLQG